MYTLLLVQPLEETDIGLSTDENREDTTSR